MEEHALHIFQGPKHFAVGAFLGGAGDVGGEQGVLGGEQGIVRRDGLRREYVNARPAQFMRIALSERISFQKCITSLV